MFPRNFPVDREVVFANLLRTCCGLVSNTANKSATSWQQVIVMEFGKRHDTTQHTQRTFALASLLQTSYGLATGNYPTEEDICTDMDNRCITLILHIHWTDFVSNESRDNRSCQILSVNGACLVLLWSSVPCRHWSRPLPSSPGLHSGSSQRLATNWKTEANLAENG